MYRGTIVHLVYVQGHNSTQVLTVQDTLSVYHKQLHLCDTNKHFILFKLVKITHEVQKNILDSLGKLLIIL